MNLKSNPKDQQKLLDFTKQNPIQLTKLPDDSYDLKDGNHRANLLYWSGIETVPVEITDASNKEVVETPEANVNRELEKNKEICNDVKLPENS